ncbi:MAG: hypothetical protein AAF585_27395 [Verrucomicrobiota bacterium]
MPIIGRVVDNRVFLLALDEMYRNSMKHHERTELLKCAREVGNSLSLKPRKVPVEGYYSEEPALAEYFKWMRTFQSAPESLAKQVHRKKSFQRLLEVSESGLFGNPANTDFLLPTGKDPFGVVLESTRPEYWDVESLTSSAHSVILQSDDFSLASLAALARDSVALAALRESTVLYSRKLAWASKRKVRPEFQYVWKVSKVVEHRAQKFVQAFNRLFRSKKLPIPSAAKASVYWKAYKGEFQIRGRCANIGYDDLTRPTQYYHWAIHSRNDDGQLFVYDFWEPEVWTTKRYREECSYY